ncbi:MAG: C39 family peptidase, partial [Defluviitaleaceae bacterium]|nr:C39 family peptidase [Defluviitaleaceae bacterium]
MNLNFTKLLFAMLLSLQMLTNTSLLDEKLAIDVPVINQVPNYMRGCEVVSLQMLLKHAGIETTTDELISKLKFDETPYKLINGRIHFGNPYLGFVGDIYTFKNPGLGVYYPPIYELM